MRIIGHLHIARTSFLVLFLAVNRYGRKVDLWHPIREEHLKLKHLRNSTHRDMHSY